MATVNNKAILVVLVISLITIIVIRLVGYMINPIITIDSLNGSSPESIIARFGAPHSEVQFNLSNHELEYRSGLNRLFPSQSDSTLVIKEMTWNDYNTLLASYTLVVWFHQKNGRWQVIDNLAWSKAIQF